MEGHWVTQQVLILVLNIMEVQQWITVQYRWTYIIKLAIFSVLNFTHLSDHCPLSCNIFCDFELYKKKETSKSIYKYIWNDEAKSKFVETVKSVEIQN